MEEPGLPWDKCYLGSRALGIGDHMGEQETGQDTHKMGEKTTRPQSSRREEATGGKARKKHP